MKMVKRIVGLLLVFVMALGMITGCEAKEKNSGDNTLTVGIPQDTTISDYDTNALTKYLEETTGIDIEWVFFASGTSNYQQQLTLMCVGQETLPDMLLGFNGLSHYVVNQFGEDGYIIDLRELIDEYAVNYKEQLSKLDEDYRTFIEEKGTNTNDGSFYAMPTIGNDCIDNMQSMIYINQTWLNNLGLQAPKNLAELESVCAAFATKDPNGNGEADEIPMLGGASIQYWLLNAFVEYDAGNFNVAGGKVWDPVVSDEFRKGLGYINDLKDKGYYSELGFTITTAEMKNLISPQNSDGKVGIFSGHHEVMTNASTNALGDYVALGTLEDATGKGGYNIVADRSLSWGTYITADCKNPELAMKFIDAFYTDESMTRQRYGEKDVDWYYEEGTNAYGTQSYTNVVNAQAYFDGSLNKTLGQLLYVGNHWNSMTVLEENTGRDADAFRLQKEQWEIKENSGKQRENLLDSLIYTSEEYEVREMKAGEVSNFIRAQSILFMSGEKDVNDDATWNEFKNTLQTLGQGELMEIAQKAYDRKAGK